MLAEFSGDAEKFSWQELFVFSLRVSRRSFGRSTVRYPVQMIFWTLVSGIAKNSEEIFLSMLWATLLLTIHRSKINLAERV